MGQPFLLVGLGLVAGRKPRKLNVSEKKMYLYFDNQRLLFHCTQIQTVMKIMNLFARPRGF